MNRREFMKGIAALSGIATAGVIGGGARCGGCGRALEYIGEEHLCGASWPIVVRSSPVQSRRIIEYDGTTKTATVSPAWKTNPGNDTEYIIWANPGRGQDNE